jgi:hypothetical protein
MDIIVCWFCSNTGKIFVLVILDQVVSLLCPWKYLHDSSGVQHEICLKIGDLLLYAHLEASNFFRFQTKPKLIFEPGHRRPKL